MKVHNSLKELLEVYSDYCQEMSWIEMDKDLHEFTDEFLASNSLALGKAEPLAKNKDSGNENCICDNVSKGTITMGWCPIHKTSWY